MKKHALKVKSFFEEFKAFLEEQLTHLKNARAETKEISEWVAQMGVSNIDSATSKIDGKYQDFSEEQFDLKVKKHLERAAEFLKRMHFNTSLMSPIPPEWVHQLQKDKSGALLEQCKALLAYYPGTERTPNKPKSWLSVSLQWLYLLQSPRSVVAIWDKTDRSEISKILNSIIALRNKIETDEKNTSLSVPKVSKSLEEELKLSPVFLRYRQPIKQLVDNIEKGMYVGSPDKKSMEEEVAKIKFFPKPHM